MKVLIIKTTSMGDVIHTLPALTDAGKNITGIRFDWVVEKPFAEIPALHPLVDTVIPVHIRKWRKNWFKALRSPEWKEFREAIQAKHYDYIIDAQGLMKSALIVRLAKGLRCGLNWKSAREPLASLCYKKKTQ
jgi:heptosyltransferase-1